MRNGRNAKKRYMVESLHSYKCFFAEIICNAWAMRLSVALAVRKLVEG
jgi:hypothetical protein